MCHPNNSTQSFGVTVDSFPSSSALEMEAYKETANKILKVGLLFLLEQANANYATTPQQVVFMA